jgi:hypothetical protein
MRGIGEIGRMGCGRDRPLRRDQDHCLVSLRHSM